MSEVLFFLLTMFALMLVHLLQKRRFIQSRYVYFCMSAISFVNYWLIRWLIPYRRPDLLIITTLAVVSVFLYDWLQDRFWQDAL